MKGVASVRKRHRKYLKRGGREGEDREKSSETAKPAADTQNLPRKQARNPKVIKAQAGARSWDTSGF